MWIKILIFDEPNHDELVLELLGGRRNVVERNIGDDRRIFRQLAFGGVPFKFWQRKDIAPRLNTQDKWIYSVLRTYFERE